MLDLPHNLVFSVWNGQSDITGDSLLGHKYTGSLECNCPRIIDILVCLYLSIDSLGMITLVNQERGTKIIKCNWEKKIRGRGEYEKKRKKYDGQWGAVQFFRPADGKYCPPYLSHYI